MYLPGLCGSAIACACVCVCVCVSVFYDWFHDGVFQSSICNSHFFFFSNPLSVNPLWCFSVFNLRFPSGCFRSCLVSLHHTSPPHRRNSSTRVDHLLVLHTREWTTYWRNAHCNVHDLLTSVHYDVNGLLTYCTFKCTGPIDLEWPMAYMACWRSVSILT